MANAPMSPKMDAAAAADQPDLGTVRRAVAASAIGNAVEWFDYGVFTSGAITTTIGSQFFPGGHDAVLKSLALVAIGFLVRPFGGMFFGPLGDKLGRQRVLAATIFLMSSCTFLVGVLPTYAAIGIWAPILLLALRLLQGFSTGGEYGGAATFMAEYAPPVRRGFFGSFLEFGTLSGYVFGNVLVLVVTLAAGESGLHAWAWRIPFLLGLPLGMVGLYMRMKLEDTPTFRAQTARDETPHNLPLGEVLANGNWKMVLNLIGIVFLLNIADYMLLTTMPSFFVTKLHIGATTALLIIIGVELCQMAVIAPLGALSDRVGRKPILLTAAVGYMVISYPALQLMQSGSVIGVIVGFGAVAFLLVMMLSTIGSTFPAMFPTRVRYGSFAIGYNLSTSLFGGTTGVVTTALVNATGDLNWPAYYLILAGAVAIVPILNIPETARVPIEAVVANGVTADPLPLDGSAPAPVAD